LRNQEPFFAALSVALTLSVGIVGASPPDSLWSRTYGGSSYEYCNAVQCTQDRGYALAGETSSFGAGGYDFWLVKTDSNGDSLWSRTFGGADHEYCMSLSVEPGTIGGYVLAGKTRSFGAGEYDFWLVKASRYGDSLWSRTYGGTDHEACQSVQPTPDGGYALGGWTRSFGSGQDDFWLVKTNAYGDSLWSRTFGGSGEDVCRAIQRTPDGGYILAGYTTSFGAGSYDFWLVKTNASGDSLWSRTYGGTSWDRCTSAMRTADGGYILAGHTASFGSGQDDFWLVKTDANGDSLWSQTFGSTDPDWCIAMRQSADHGYIMAGYTESFGMGKKDAWLVKADANGNSLWSRTFGGTEDDYGRSVVQTPGGGYAVAGYTRSFGAGMTDFWLVGTGPEAPYYATDYLNLVGTNLVVRWIAPQTCSYLVYTTTEPNNVSDPPGPGWILGVTLPIVPAGPASWLDPAPIVPYKKYVVVMSCP